MAEPIPESDESIEVINPVRDGESLYDIGLESTGVSGERLKADLFHDNGQLIRKMRRFVRLNFILSLLLLLGLSGQIYWTVTHHAAIQAAPELELLLQNGRRVKDHTYKFDLFVHNRGTRYADGVSLWIGVPEGILIALDGKMSFPPEEGREHSVLEQTFPGHILKGKEAFLAPIIFKFKEPKPFEEIAFIFRSPDIEDQHGKFIVKDPDYWSTTPLGADAHVTVSDRKLWEDL